MITRTSHVHVELDVTPRGWSDPDNGTNGAAIDAMMKALRHHKLPIVELRVQPRHLLAVVVAPVDDVPVSRLHELAADLRNTVETDKPNTPPHTGVVGVAPHVPAPAIAREVTFHAPELKRDPVVGRLMAHLFAGDLREDIRVAAETSSGRQLAATIRRRANFFALHSGSFPSRVILNVSQWELLSQFVIRITGGSLGTWKCIPGCHAHIGDMHVSVASDGPNQEDYPVVLP